MRGCRKTKSRVTPGGDRSQKKNGEICGAENKNKSRVAPEAKNGGQNELHLRRRQRETKKQNHLRGTGRQKITDEKCRAEKKKKIESHA